MGAGGSHPQAPMMPDPWATNKSLSVSQAMVTSPLPASQSFSNFSGKSRNGRPRSNMRAQDDTAVLEETLRLFVEATDKDEASMRQQLVNKRSAELLRDRELWRTRVEEKQRFHIKKQEAWEFFRRLPSFRPKKQEHFEEEFKQKVMTRCSSGSHEGRERYLDEWTVELQKKALEEDRRLEAKELGKMGEEDRHSQSRQAWDQIRERGTSNRSPSCLSRSDHEAIASTLLWCEGEAQADLNRHFAALMYQPILRANMNGSTHEFALREVCGIRLLVDFLPLSDFPWCS